MPVIIFRAMLLLLALSLILTDMAAAQDDKPLVLEVQDFKPELVFSKSANYLLRYNVLDPKDPSVREYLLMSWRDQQNQYEKVSKFIRKGAVLNRAFVSEGGKIVLIEAKDGVRQEILMMTPQGNVLKSYDFQDYLRIMQHAKLKVATRELSWICFWSDSIENNIANELELIDVHGNLMSLNLTSGELKFIDVPSVCEY